MNIPSVTAQEMKKIDDLMVFEYGETAKLKLRPLKALNMQIFKPDSSHFDQLVELKSADLIIDALLGYSIQGDPHSEVASAIYAINKADRPVLANDIPSGMNPDTGAPYHPIVRADVTLTLALPKKGLLAPQSQELVGKLYLAD